MAIYLGNGEKVKISFNGSFCSLKVASMPQSVSNNCLISSDDYILKDSDGVYLIAKESE